METFKQDPRPNKINLSIGIYFDNEGKMPFPNSVFQAAQRIENQVQPYLPMEGHAGFRAAVAKLLFGAESLVLQENRVAAVQTLGGSGALKLGADFIHRWFPQSHVFVSDPTWDNHRGIFEGAGFEVGSYPYYDPATIGVKFDAMCDFFRSLPEHSVVLLHLLPQPNRRGFAARTMGYDFKHRCRTPAHSVYGHCLSGFWRHV